ncbi:glutathione S-transferase family protein [Chloroflexi bacterium TSY]|nr:glutathione S-transferase family protein [Chloroflexi bacterium TSY]
MLIVWGRRNSLNVQKVMWAIGELGLDAERRDVGGSFGGNDTDAYKKLNPNCRVPTIEDNGFVLWESNACVRYLAEQYGQRTLWPADRRTRALADQWMDWLNSTLYSAMAVPFMALLRMPIEQRDQALIDAAAVELSELYQLLDSHLAGQSYVAGNEFTMGDIPVGCATWRYYNLAIERPTLPNLESWYERLLERPAYQQHVAFPFGTTPEEWTQLEQEGAGK